jgi:hypothetical protein
VKYGVVILEMSALVALAAVIGVEKSYSQTPSRSARVNHIVRAAAGLFRAMVFVENQNYSCPRIAARRTSALGSQSLS